MYEPIHFRHQTIPSGWEIGKGPGRISSTAEDLLKWDQALYGEKMVRLSYTRTGIYSGESKRWHTNRIWFWLDDQNKCKE